MKVGFDSKMYMQKQTEHILERINRFDKLYLEFGGKLFDDLHAARVLPGFDKAAKIKLLQKLRDKAELIICINANAIERNKIRADYGITYGSEVERMIDNISAMGIYINCVVITMFTDQQGALAYKQKLENRGIKVYIHRPTKGYPHEIDTIVSDEGYGANPYIETTRPLVVLTAPGPGSGKLATCLSQLYHENKRGVQAGYAKFETFPIWNIPLKHPINLAYEAATADLRDVNMIDSFHLEAYGEMAVNYNRDLEVFPVIKRIIEKITGEESEYKSPTDMGVNRAGFAITDNEVCEDAAKQEIIRRYLIALCDYKKGKIEAESLERAKLLMDELDLKLEDRTVIQPARDYVEMKRNCDDRYLNVVGMAIQLNDGRIITGRSSRRMVAAGAMILNAVKALAGIEDEVHLIAPDVLEGIQRLKTEFLEQDRTSLTCEEILTALVVSGTTNPAAAKALEYLKELKGCRAHCTAILSDRDEYAVRSLGIDVTCDPDYATTNLYLG